MTFGRRRELRVATAGDPIAIQGCRVECWLRCVAISADIAYPATGSTMILFVWPGAYRGRISPPQVKTIAFAVSSGGLDYWADRLGERGVEHPAVAERFGERGLAFADPDGM